MSFLGGPECSTGANPLAQFQKQTSADTSLQRDRLTQRPPQLNGFRNQQVPDDAAFQDFRQQGPLLGEQLPQLPDYQQQMYLLEQANRERAAAGGGGNGGGGWAGEFAQQPPAFTPEQFAQQQGRGGAFTPQDFANFRQQQISPISRQSAQSPSFQPQSTYQRPSMYGGNLSGMMQRPMMYQQAQPMYGQQPQQEQYQGKGKGRIQELSDTEWEKQFEELTTEDKEAELDELDADAEQAIEAELNQMDRYVPLDSLTPALTLHCVTAGQHGNVMVRSEGAGFGSMEDIWRGYQAETDVARDMLADDDLGHMGEYDEWKDFDGLAHDFDGVRTFENRGPETANYLFEEENLFSD
ncbi:Peroxisomal membrane signal receptor PTS1, partial [Teratosphaeriaceae sp. CCFEE 6253]